MSSLKEQIIDCLKSITDEGYEIHLTERSIAIIEVFKSQSRDKYIEKEAFASIGLEKLANGTLRITLSDLKKWQQELTPPKEYNNKENDGK